MSKLRIGLLTCTPSLLLAGCATPSREKPFLTDKAFERAAAACDVVSQGVHHSRGSKIPYANYKLPRGQKYLGDDITHECLANALTGYRYDFFGEDMSQTTE